jgi:hypothetical protein
MPYQRAEFVADMNDHMSATVTTAMNLPNKLVD